MQHHTLVQRLSMTANLVIFLGILYTVLHLLGILGLLQGYRLSGLAVALGILGLGLYAWLMICLLRLCKSSQPVGQESPFLDSQFRKLWPLILGVYLLNASAVVMNYQFVNALLFTIAGVLAAQNNRGRQMGLQAASI